MAINTRLLTYTVYHTDGTPWEDGTVTFTLRGESYTGDGTVLPSTVTSTSGEAGEGEAELWTNAEGYRPSEYLYTLPDGSRGTFVLPAGDTPISLESLRLMAGIYPWSATELADLMQFYRDELAAVNGANLIGYVQSGALAVTRTVRDRLRERLSFFDFISPALHTDIKDGTSSVDLTTNIASLVTAAAEGATVTAVPGLYTGHIASTKSLVIDGAGSTIQPTTNQALIRIGGRLGTEVEMMPAGGRKVTDAAVSSLGTSITSATAAFTAGDVGSAIVISGIGVATRTVTELSVTANSGDSTIVVNSIRDVNTTLNLAMTAGATRVTPTSMADAAAGRLIEITLDDASIHTSLIDSVEEDEDSDPTYFTIADPLPSQASAGNLVQSPSSVAIGQTIVISKDNNTAFTTSISNIVGTTITLSSTLNGNATLLATTLTASASALASSVTVADVSRISSGVWFTIALDNGTTFRATASGAPTGNVVPLVNPVPSAAASGNAVTIVPSVTIRMTHRPLIATISAYTSPTQVSFSSTSNKASAMTGLTAWIFPAHLGYGTYQVQAQTADLAALPASEQIAVDSIVTFHDSTERGDGSPINNETAKVKAITVDGATTTFTLYDMVRNEHRNFPLALRRVITVKNPVVRNWTVDRNNLGGTAFSSVDRHDQPMVWFYCCENPFAENITVKDNIGHAVRFEYCYQPHAERITVLKPPVVTSGEGYGVTFKWCRHFTAKTIFGSGTRHAIDIDGSYSGVVDGVIEDNARGVPVIVAHNGYAGDMHISNVHVVGSSYAVASSGTALLEAQTDMRQLRDVTIEKVTHIVPEKIFGSATVISPESFMVSVYFQTDINNVHINGLRVYYLNTATPALTSGGDSVMVRVNGVARGLCTMRNLKANTVGTVLYLVRQNGTDAASVPVILDGVEVETCAYVLHNAGGVNTTVSNIRVGTIVSGGASIKLRLVANTAPSVLNCLGEWSVPITATFLDESLAVDVYGASLLHSSGLRGTPPSFTLFSTSGLELSGASPAASEITIDRMIYASRYLPLLAPVGTDATLDATTPFPRPIWLGQECRIAVDSVGAPGTRGDIIIPHGSTTFATTSGYNTAYPITTGPYGVTSSGVVLRDGKVYTLVATSGRKWMIEE